MEIPVILIHKGYSDYLQHTIRMSSKNNKTYLISDTNPNVFCENFIFINSQDYLELLTEFTPHYEHMNTTPFNYELFCYHRWFMLKEFMEKNQIDNVFYIDSDVLLFENISNEWVNFNQYDITLLHRTAAISSFITKKGIDNFCNMLLLIYKNKDGYPFKKIKSHYTIRQQSGLGGGVCDMTLLEFFHYHSEYGGGPGRVGEMMNIINESTYDHNINAEDNDYDFVNNLKNIQIINKKPFVFNKHLNKLIKFNTIHFQGGAKHLIKTIYDQCY